MLWLDCLINDMLSWRIENNFVPPITQNFNLKFYTQHSIHLIQSLLFRGCFKSWIWPRQEFWELKVCIMSNNKCSFYSYLGVLNDDILLFIAFVRKIYVWKKNLKKNKKELKRSESKVQGLKCNNSKVESDCKTMIWEI